MKPIDEDEENPSPEELAAALEGGAAQPAAGGVGPSAEVSDALETAALLRHARAPLTVPAGHEAIVAAHVAPALDARRDRRRRRSRIWIAASVVAPAAAAAWLLFAVTATRHAPMSAAPTAPPPPTADLLAVQAQATRGGSQTTGALAALDLKMREYRRQYHQGLRHRRGGEP
jgi:hypothetical protein